MPFGPLIPALIGAAGGIGGGLLARSGANNIADTQKSIAQQNLARTGPAFDQAYGYYSNLLKGDPTSLMTALGPDVTNTNLFFNQARQNTINGAYGLGGGLQAGLANVEGQKAATLSDIFGTARQGAAGALSNLATGNQNQAIQALGGASSANYLNSAIQSQAFSGIGNFISKLIATPGLFAGGNSNRNNIFPNGAYDTYNPPPAVLGTGNQYQTLLG